MNHTSIAVALLVTCCSCTTHYSVEREAEQPIRQLSPDARLRVVPLSAQPFRVMVDLLGSIEEKRRVRELTKGVTKSTAFGRGMAMNGLIGALVDDHDRSSAPQVVAIGEWREEFGILHLPGSTEIVVEAFESGSPTAVRVTSLKAVDGPLFDLRRALHGALGASHPSRLRFACTVEGQVLEIELHVANAWPSLSASETSR